MQTFAQDLEGRKGLTHSLSHPTARCPVWPPLMSPLLNVHPVFCTLLPTLFPPPPRAAQRYKTNHVSLHRKGRRASVVPPTPIPMVPSLSQDSWRSHNPCSFIFMVITTQLPRYHSLFDIRFITMNSRTPNCFL